MRWTKYAMPFVVVMILAGCWSLSIHPLYTEDDLVQDPMLVGKWYNPEEMDQIWMFEANDEKGYRLTVFEGIEAQLKEAVENQSRLELTVDPNKDAMFDVHLLKLDQYTFVDFFPEEPANVNEFYKLHVIPAHSFSRISIEGNVLTLGFFDSKWLMDQLKEGKVSIKVEDWNDLKVITADTRDLQKFVLDHIDEAFEPPDVLKRLD